MAEIELSVMNPTPQTAKIMRNLLQEFSRPELNQFVHPEDFVAESLKSGTIINDPPEISRDSISATMAKRIQTGRSYPMVPLWGLMEDRLVAALDQFGKSIIEREDLDLLARKLNLTLAQETEGDASASLFYIDCEGERNGFIN